MEILDNGITSPKGFRAAGVHCGMKKYHKKDIALVVAGAPCAAAAAYTRNQVKAAPLLITMEHMRRSGAMLRGFAVNSGNANALTGGRGLRDALRMARTAARLAGAKPWQFAVASTGVIGRYLPMDRVLPGIRAAHGRLGTTREAALEAAEAIMTTDTHVKECAVRTRLSDGTLVTLAGMAKGSGMIAPSMSVPHATMLCFLTTDAVVQPEVLEERLQYALDRTFNMISVDGDTSTNDFALILASGLAGGKEVEGDAAFDEALLHVLGTLARMVAQDGEGATKFLTVEVTGATSYEDARRAVKAVLNSNLVKTAFFGEDPNFGRIVAALGNSGCPVSVDRVCLTLRGENDRSAVLVSNGIPKALPGKRAFQTARAILKEKNLHVLIDLGLGRHSAKGWGCDLSYGYVEVNSAYTT